MPSTDSSIVPPKADATLPILQAPKTNRIINEILNAAQDIRSVEAGASFNFLPDKFKDILLPSSPFSAVLHSNPVNIGVYSTSSTGQLNAALTIPAGTEPGFHTVHFYGKNIAGNPVDIQQTIYVSASVNDYDGDGVANRVDSCLYLPNSKVDIDRDGIDDVCDSEIGPVPTQPSQPLEPASVQLQITTPLDTFTNHDTDSLFITPTVAKGVVLGATATPDNQPKQNPTIPSAPQRTQSQRVEMQSARQVMILGTACILGLLSYVALRRWKLQ